MASQREFRDEVRKRQHARGLATPPSPPSVAPRYGAPRPSVGVTLAAAGLAALSSWSCVGRSVEYPAGPDQTPAKHSGDRVVSEQAALSAPLEAPPPSGGGQRGNEKSPLGTNLELFTYYSRNWVLVDIFPASGYDMYGEGIEQRNSDGWPVVSARPSTLRGGQPREFYQYDGQYVVLWQGSPAALTIGAGEPARCDDGTTDLTRCRSRRALVNTNVGQHPLMMDARNEGPSRALQSMQIFMPGGVCGVAPNRLDLFTACATPRGGRGQCPSGQTCYDFETVGWNRFKDPVSAMTQKVVFHPDYLQTLKSYRALRFMDWMETNDGNTVVAWKDRPLVTQPRYTYKEHGGTPVEYLVALSNTLQADPWFTIPHRASDDYVRRFAARVNELLRRDLKVYVEYSNETWNGAYAYQPQHQYVMARGRELGLGGNEVTDEFGRGRLFHARRSAEVAAVFEKEFDRKDRIIGVLGAWNIQPAQSEMMIRFLREQGLLDHLDALAIAPYFGAKTGGTTDAIFQSILSGTEESYNIAQTMRFVKENAALARASGLALLAYEGGQHLTAGDDEAQVQKLAAVNRDPRMREAYTKYLGAWREAGGTLFMHYLDVSEFGVHGYWGAREAQSQPLAEAPKAQALEEFVTKNPCWWPGCGR